jgi:surface polysaccharide O-acyltransferase-like enzyme
MPAMATATTPDPAGPAAPAVPPAAVPREPGLDLVRIVATVGVIAVHAAGPRVDTLPDVDSIGWLTAEVVDASCRWVVPVFIMLSGLLTLGQERFSAGAFYRKRLTRVAIPLAVWATVYFVWESWYYQYDLEWAIVGKALRDGLTCNHLWFVFLILGLYVVAPPLRLAVRAAPPLVTWAAAIAGYAIVASGVVAEHVELDASTRWAIYLPCFVAGWLLRRPDRRLGIPSAVAFVAATAWIIIGTHRSAAAWPREDEEHAFALYQHFHPAVIIQSLSAFLALRALPEPASARLRALIPRLAASTFGVYLVHILPLTHLQVRTDRWSPDLMPLILPLEIAAVYAVSTLATMAILRVRGLRVVVGG